MPIKTSVMRANLRALSPLLKQSALSLEHARGFQDKKGELMKLAYLMEADQSEPFQLGDFFAAWAEPRHPPRHGVILYLHGGGYVFGGLDYALGFGSILATVTGRRVLCPGYRLAPERPYPAQLEDAVASYNHLLSLGYRGDEIVLCGESAGGGLVLALALKLRDTGAQMPAGVVSISPWTDLTLSGESYAANKKSDPSISCEMLEYCRKMYAPGAENWLDPYVSPLMADLEGMPRCLMFAGGDEVLLSDSILFADKLERAGGWCRLHVEEKMWHVYVLYAVEEARAARAKIAEFVEECIG